MAEYINKADAMKVACGFMRFTGIDEAPYEYADNLLNNLPTIDIVFCKDCKHRRGGNCFREEPKGFNHKKDTDYCSKGERRTE